MSIQETAAKIKGYRTVAFNVVAGVVGALYGNEAVQLVQSLGLTADQAVDALVGLIVAGNVVLRFFTTTPVGQR